MTNEDNQGTTWFTTRDGARIRREDPVWVAVGPAHRAVMEVGSLPASDEGLRLRVLDFIQRRLETVSAATAGSEWRVLLTMFGDAAAAGHGPASEVTMDAVGAFGRARASAHSQLHRLARTLDTWAASGLPGLGADVLAALPLEAPLAPSPSPVRLRCPDSGALTVAEAAEAISSLLGAWEMGSIKLEDVVLALLVLVGGLRTGQVALLKVTDLSEPHADGQRRLRVLKLKQRVPLGTSFTMRAMTSLIGDVIASQAEAARAEAAGRGIHPDAAPLLIHRFPRKRGDEGHRAALDLWAGHRTGSEIGTRFTTVMNRLGLASHRTERLQRFTGRRARRTLATIERRRGGTLLDAARILDHSGVRTVRTYTESTREAVDRWEAALRGQLEAVARLFARKRRDDRGGDR